MRKLTYEDLTQEFLKGISPFTEANQIIEYCREKELEIDEKHAKKLLEQLRKADELSHEALSKVAGGQGQYSGTRILSKSVPTEEWPCDYDCNDRDWWDCPEDEYQNCMIFTCWYYEPPRPS